MFESALVLQREQNQRIHDEALGFPSPVDNAVLEYPSQLAIEALHSKVFHYPAGITSLALNSRLSLQFLNYFHVFWEWFLASTSVPGPHDSMTELGHDILGMPGLSFVERSLVVAIQAYLNWLERTKRKWCNISSEHEVEVQVGALRRSEPPMDTCTDDRKEAFVWCCLMIRDTSARGSVLRRWAYEHLVTMNMKAKEERALDHLFFSRPGSPAH